MVEGGKVWGQLSLTEQQDVACLLGPLDAWLVMHLFLKLYRIIENNLFYMYIKLQLSTYSI